MIQVILMYSATNYFYCCCLAYNQLSMFLFDAF